MEITDLRNNGIIARGRIVTAEACGGMSIRIITDTGYKIYLTKDDIAKLNDDIEGCNIN